MPANPSPLAAPTAEDHRAWYHVQSAALAHDRPGEPVPSQAAVRAGLTTTGSRRQLVLWLLRGSGDEPVATAVLRLSGTAADGSGTDGPADVQMTVHPAHRRLGTGSRLLATVTEAATAAGCASLAAEAVSGTPGEGFLATRDFVPVTRLTWQRLALDDIPDPVGKLPDVPHPGYRLTAWEGAVPDTLTDGFLGALRALPTPAAGLDTGGCRWDPAAVHEAAELAARRGDRLLTVAALHDGGDVAGYTTVLLPGDGARRAQQHDTAVVPAHRGHGLGLWMKAEMLRRLPAAQPDLAEIHTCVPDDNRHLLAVNTSLGFRPLRRTVRFRLRLRRR
jgi:GNAT superfamily N-acetyltransferase